MQNKEFKSVPFWQVALNTTDGVKLISAAKWDEKGQAERAYNTASKARNGKVIKAEKKQKTELPPLLFSLEETEDGTAAIAVQPDRSAEGCKLQVWLFS